MLLATRAAETAGSPEVEASGAGQRPEHEEALERAPPPPKEGLPTEAGVERRGARGVGQGASASGWVAGRWRVSRSSFCVAEAKASASGGRSAQRSGLPGRVPDRATGRRGALRRRVRLQRNGDARPETAGRSTAQQRAALVFEKLVAISVRSIEFNAWSWSSRQPMTSRQMAQQGSSAMGSLLWQYPRETSQTGEFDPGSERTLAAGLTHASRAGGAIP